MNAIEKINLPKRLEENDLWKLMLLKLQDEKNPYLSLNVECLINAINFSVEHIEKIKYYFPKYTIHGCQHSFNVMQLIFNLLISMEVVQKRDDSYTIDISSYEIALLVLASFFHDIGMSMLNGMSISNEKWFPEFRSKNKNLNETNLSTKYIRCFHHLRSEIFINHFCQHNGGFCWREKSGNILRFLELKRICISHNKGKDYLENLNSYLHRDEKLCAILLRLADIMDLDNTRAPIDLMVEHNFLFDNADDNYSYYEWKKHNASEGLLFDSDGILKLLGSTNDPIVRKKISEVMSLIKFELELCQEILFQTSEPFAKKRLPQNVLDKVESIGFEFGDYSYKIEKNDALKIFMGENLYSSKLVFIRELIQNAIDASICKEKINAKRFNTLISSSPIKIEIWRDNNSEINIWLEDSGTGMNQNIIDNYFLQIGKSYYNSLDYNKLELGFTPISKFGIGFLSVFLVTSEVQVFTKHYDEKDVVKQLTLNVESDTYILRVNDYSTDKRDIVGLISKPDGNINVSELFLNKDSGTAIYFRLKTEITHGDINLLENEIYKYIFSPPVRIECYIDGEKRIFDRVDVPIMIAINESLDRDEILSAARKQTNAFKDTDSIIFESIPINFHLENSEQKIDGCIQAMTVYDTSINDYSYTWKYRLDYDKDEIDLSINNIYHKVITNIHLSPLHARAEINNSICIYFNGVKHIQRKDSSSNIESRKPRVLYNGYILLEGNIRPEVNTARSGYGTLSLNTLFQLNYLFYKSINEFDSTSERKKSVLQLNVPAFLNQLDDIYNVDDLKSLFTQEMNWDDFRFINTSCGFISINDIQTLLGQGKKIELKESIRLCHNSFGVLLKTYLILQKFCIQLSIDNKRVVIHIKQASSSQCLYDKFPSVFFIDYGEISFLRIGDYPLNINHKFSQWLIENSEKEEFRNVLDNIVSYMKKEINQSEKKREELLNNINAFLTDYRVERLTYRDILVWADQYPDLRDLLRI